MHVLLHVLVVVAAVQGVSYKGYKIYEATPLDNAQLQGLIQLSSLQRGYDFLTSPRFVGHPVQILVNPLQEIALVAFLKAKEISLSIIDSDVERTTNQIRRENEAARTRSNGRFSYDRYLRYDEINKHLDSIAAEHPDLVTVDNTGRSSEGRIIKLIKISSGGGGSKPAILLDATIHAREWMAPHVALYAIEQLINPENSDLLDNADWLIIPLINPDGYEFAHTDDIWWRKTRNVNNGSSCLGTDGNRNYDYYWMHSGASDYPCDEIYAGSAALSVPETQLLAKLLHSQQNIQLYLSVHSYGNLILYPWGYAEEFPEDWEDLHNLGVAAAQAIYNATKTKYTVQSSAEFYPAAGGSDDYAKGVAGVKYAYTIEVSGNSFTPAPRKILRIAKETFHAIRAFGEFVRDNY